MITRNRSERGSVNGWMVGTIGCLILFLIAGSLAIWAYMQYSREKSSVDSKVAIEVAKGKSEQAESDQKKFSEEAKNIKLSNLLDTVYFWSGVIAVAVVVIAGFYYTLSQDNEQQVARAKNTILGGIFVKGCCQLQQDNANLVLR